VQSRNASIPDAFIAGIVLHAHPVRGESHNQRNTTGEVAKVAISANYSLAVNSTGSDQLTSVNQPECLATKTHQCFFSGARRHPRGNCPAKNCLCHKCGKKGHFRQNVPLIAMTASTISSCAYWRFWWGFRTRNPAAVPESDDEKINVHVYYGKV